MSGYPATPARIAFGPHMENGRTPENAKTDLTATQMNLTFWQTAGAGRVLPQAIFVFDFNTASMLFQAYAFDPRQKLNAPVEIVINGVGDYTFTFASAYKNQNGVDAPFTPKAAMAMVQNPSEDSSRANVAIDGQTVQVVTRIGEDVPIHEVVLVGVWN